MDSNTISAALWRMHFKQNQTAANYRFSAAAAREYAEHASESDREGWLARAAEADRAAEQLEAADGQD